jgi:hypothetical protein
VDNERDGKISRPRKRSSSADTSASSLRQHDRDHTLGKHPLLSLGRSRNQNGELILRLDGTSTQNRQLRCSICSKKTTFYCNGLLCEKQPLCRALPGSSHSKSSLCLADHIAKVEGFQLMFDSEYSELSDECDDSAGNSAQGYVAPAPPIKARDSASKRADLPPCLTSSDRTRKPPQSPISSDLATSISSSTRSHFKHSFARKKKT